MSTKNYVFQAICKKIRIGEKMNTIGIIAAMQEEMNEIKNQINKSLFIDCNLIV